MCTGRAIVIDGKRAAKCGRDTENVKIVSGYELTLNPLDLTLVTNADVHVVVAEQTREHLVAIPKILVERIREHFAAHVCAVRISLPVQ